MVNSISPIEHIYETNGHNPVRVLCNDMEHYICKYVKRLPAFDLLSEWLGSHFLQNWGLPTPPIDIVNILHKHVNFDFLKHNVDFRLLNRAQPHYFTKPCFGSRFIKDAVEISQFFQDLPDKSKNEINKTHVLKLVLFDIWVANEDRNHNNSNAFFVQNGNSLELFAFDHACIFNTLSFLQTGKICEITHDETLMTCEFVKDLFPKQKQERVKALEKTLSELEKDFYIFVNKTQANTKTILNTVPQEWGIDVEKTHELLEKNFFIPEWTQKSWDTFESYVQINLVN